MFLFVSFLKHVLLAFCCGRNALKMNCNSGQWKPPTHGRLVQLEEHRISNPSVEGSSPSSTVTQYVVNTISAKNSISRLSILLASVFYWQSFSVKR